ncbi:SMI1/KNR4 family protein [Streptomyces sp. NPDC055722]
MSSAHDRVEALAHRVKITNLRGDIYDWYAVESSLGLALPDDYKLFVEKFPAGKFRGGISVIRPGDYEHSRQEYLGYYAYRLDDMRNMRSVGEGVFPYPIFPDPEGLLPWGVGPQDELLFWVTSSMNPNEWFVVMSDPDHAHWSEYHGSMTELLDRLTSDVEARGGQPAYDLSSEVREATLVPPRELYWDRMRRGVTRPVNQFETLAAKLSNPRRSTSLVDWREVEQRLGSSLPSDYKAFMENFGTGTYCDLRIVGPGAPGEFEMFGLLGRQRIRASRSRLDEWAPPFYPEPGGVISWGETADGWTCGWAPTSVDPNVWGIVQAPPAENLDSVRYLQGLSFSSFLLKYADSAERPEKFQGRKSWTGRAVFFPASSGDA